MKSNYFIAKSFYSSPLLLYDTAVRISELLNICLCDIAMESVPIPTADEAPMWKGDEDEMARLCGLH